MTVENTCDSKNTLNSVIIWKSLEKVYLSCKEENWGYSSSNSHIASELRDQLEKQRLLNIQEHCQSMNWMVLIRLIFTKLLVIDLQVTRLDNNTKADMILAIIKFNILAKDEKQSINHYTINKLSMW